MNKQLIKDLKATRKVLKPEGAWATGTISPDGCFCLLQAAAYVITGNRNDWPNYDDNDGILTVIPRLADVYKALQEGIPHRRPVWVWNDAYGRTQADVLNLIDETIKRESAQ